ncbi:MAG: amidohydrolase family protein [Phycisphaerales bacterium]|nr:amidohydrolase family protein [Phycisphaerales bacterium]
MSTNPITLLTCAGLADAVSIEFTGASALLEHVADGAVRVLAAGKTKEVTPHEAARAARVVGLPRSVLIPGLVNAHCHLDLTHVGPVPADPAGGFAAFARVVMGRRAQDSEGIAASVRRGIDLSLAGGTVAVGDIAGSPRAGPTLVPYETLGTSPLRGVSYLEFFGIGRSSPFRPGAGPSPPHPGGPPWQQLLEPGAVRSPSGVALGLQPHAPYTVSPRLYAWAAGRGLPLSTHLAETPEEREFIARGTGPLRELLERIGAWEDSVLSEIGSGQHPVHHLRQFLHARPLLAHVNDCPDDALGVLAASGASVAYCPRSSEYFGAERAFGPHRYRDMLAAEINVCLGTDSIINLPASADDPNRGGISVLDEMRRLWARDRTDARTLLRMATLNGAAALGLSRSSFSLAPGSEPLGVLAVDVSGTPTTLPPLERVMASGAPPRFVAGIGA